VLVEFHPRVQDDLAHVVLYYDREDVGLGDGFLEDYRLTLKNVLRDATVYRKFYKDFRKLNFRRFKTFTIIYKVHKDAVLIRAVADLRRDPKYWQQR